MSKYKIGDPVISRPKSGGCAPDGSMGIITMIYPHQEYGGIPKDMYGVHVPGDGIYNHYEDELDPNDCKFCQKGATFQSIHITATIAIHNYILGNELRTVIDFGYEDQTSFVKIKICPFCGAELHELPDEEMEEEIDD
jgi:hypothetical protein